MRLFPFTASLLALSLTACVVAPPPQRVTMPQQQPVQRSEFGRVAQIELVRSEERPQTTGAGAIIGGIAGAVLGHQLGGGLGKDAATVLGGVGGAVVGNAIEGHRRAGEMHEYLKVSVQADDGSYRYFSVSPQIDLRTGDRVRMENGRLFRQ